MTEQPSWAGDVPSYTAVRGPLPLPQWDEVSQNTLDDLRLRLRESVTESILMAVRGFFIPGPLGTALQQLASWGSEVLNGQNLLDAMNGNYTGDNGVLLAIEAIFVPIRGIVNAIVEPLREWLTWMWNLFSNVTPNPEPTGIAADILVPLFKWLDGANLQSLTTPTINAIWSRLNDGAEAIGKTAADIFTGVGDFVEGLVPAVTGVPGALSIGSITTWAQGLITKALTWLDFKTIYGEIPEKILGVIPIANINIVNPELMSQGGFDTSTALAAGTGWAWDGTTTRSGSGGSAKVTGNGTALSLYSNQSISVAPGDLLYISCWVKSTGTVGAGAITLSVVEFTETGVAATQSAGSAIASRAGSATFVQIGSSAGPPIVGTAYTVPAGVTSIRVKVAVTAGAATGSTVWFDDISVKKTGLLNGNWMNGVFGTVAQDIGSTLNELYDGLGDGTTPAGTQRTPAQVRVRGATVRGSAVAGENKSTTLNTLLYNSQAPTGTILTAAVPGLQASKITSGEFDSAQIPTLGRSKLLNPDFSNALQDGGFETGTAGTSTGSWGTSGGGVIATIADPKVGGTKVLSVASSGAILDTYMLPTIPVSPAEVWYGECWVRKTTAGGTGTYQLGATVDKDGASPQYPSFLTADVSTLTQNVWTKISGFVTIPDAINRLTVRPSVRNSVAAGTTIQFDNVVVRKATQYELADGAITNVKVGTDIDAGKLGTGTLPLARITDNTLPGGKLVDGNVAGAKLAANSIDAGTKLTGTIADGQIPVINTAKIPTLDPIKVTGLPSLVSSTNDAGVVTLRTVESSLVDLATDVAALKVDREVTTNQGKTISVSFVQLPNTNDLPTTGTQTWSTQYLTGSGPTPTFGVTSGKATWKSSGTRTAKVLYRGTGTRQLLSTGTAGTFTLTLGATTTGPLAHNATAAAVQTALGAAYFTVSGTNALTGLTLTPVASTTTVAGISPISGALSITSSVTGGVATLSDGGDTTLTDFQSLRGVLADPPSIFGTGYSTAFTALARVSQDGMSYVFARAYWAALGNLRGEIGYCNGGVETIWQSNIALTWSTELTFRLGVDDNPRAYQVFSGSTLVTRYDEGYANFGAFPATGQVTGRTYVDNTGNRLVVTATGGSFTLTAGGATTGAIAFNASQATVAASLNAALNLAYSGNAAAGVVYATVSGTAANTAGTAGAPGGLVVTFTSKVKGLTVGNVNMTVNPALLTGGSATVANRYTWNGTTAFVTSTATSGPGAASPLGPTSRRFGAEVRANGSNNSGTISSVAVSDNPPVVYAGSVARMSRLNTANVGSLSTTDTALPNNFFDDVEFESLDIDANLTLGSFTVTKSKMYLINARVKLKEGIDANSYLNLQMWTTGAAVLVQRGGSLWAADTGNFARNPTSGFVMTATWLQYLEAGASVRLSANCDRNSYTTPFTGAWSETYFTISALQ